jgi:sugar phosphate isomerase/epimerase
MNRRRFLTHAGALAASSVVGFDLLSQSARTTTCAGPAPAVQLYTVRDALARDPRAALASLREIGIVEAELYGLSGPASATLFGMPASDFKRACDTSGIRLAATHIGGDLANHGAIAEIARAVGAQAVIVALPSEFSGQVDGRFAMVPAQSRAQLDALVAKLNGAGREYRDRGLAFGYHNHHIEFTPVDGVVPYDYLMSNTDPDLVKIELDVGWLATAGVDPVAYLRRHAGRVIACHLKDYDPAIATDVPQRKLVAPGAGQIDFAAVLAAMRETGVTDDAMADVRRGHAHLQALKGCA